MIRRTLFLILLSCLQGGAVAENTAHHHQPQFVRKEPAEKEIWYSNLVTKAILFYGKACESGESDACFKLGMIFDTGEIAVRDKAKAAEAYQLACNQGSASGCNNLGVLFGTGDGVASDLKQAAELFALSCALNEEVACVNQSVLQHQ